MFADQMRAAIAAAPRAEHGQRLSTSVYDQAETLIRQRLLARPQARGQGRSRQFIDRTVALGVWFLRKHGPYGARIFSACRMVLAKLLRLKDCAIRTSLKALQEIGLLHHLPRANGHDRKFKSPEYAAFQFELGTDFALVLFFSRARGSYAQKYSSAEAELSEQTLVHGEPSIPGA